MNRYENRRVLITGAGSGIGQATVLRLLAEGATVAAVDISPEGLADTITKAGASADRIITVKMDIGDERSVIVGVAAAVEALGGLDTLINAAGILRSARTEDTTVDDFDLILRINLRGTFLVIREAIPALRGGQNPAVVNFSSTSAVFAHPYMPAYAASKAGIQAMTHSLALEFAKDNIRFNCVQPGSVSSGITEGTGKSGQNKGNSLPEGADVSLVNKLFPALPLPAGAMFADPSTVASVVAMLGSADAAFITGTEIRVDGGTHM